MTPTISSTIAVAIIACCTRTVSNLVLTPAKKSTEDLPVPTPAEDEVLVRVHAAAVTRDELDWPTDRLPAIPSYELSGIVVAGDAPGVRAGQEVSGLTGFDRDGVAAEYATVLVSQLSPKPQSLSHVESAAVPLPALSAMQGLFDHGHLSKNQRVLIHGGAGGVGAFAVQLARLHGAYVIATTSSTRVHLAHDLGVDEVINHATTDFTDIDHVDLVFDTAGGTRLKRSVEVVGEGARIVSVAEPPPVEECERRGIDAIFFLVQPNQDQLQHLAGLADRGSLRVVVDRTYPLAEARDAFAYTMERGGSGKVVLTMGANG